MTWGGRHFQRWKEVDHFHDRQENERVFLVDQLPRNAMGKVQKTALRERYKESFA